MTSENKPTRPRKTSRKRADTSVLTDCAAPGAPKGLYLRGGVWWIRYTRDGKQVRESSESSDQARAVALLSRRHAEAAGGSVPAELTMAGLRDLWLRTRSRKASIETDRFRWPLLLELLGAETRAEDLHPERLQRLVGEIEARPSCRGGTLKPATVNRHLALLRAALRLAELHGHLSRSPMRGVSMLPEHNHRDRVCSPEEYRRLLGAATGDIRVAIVLAYHGGFRLGEITHLTWGEVDLEAGVARLHSSKTKTGKARAVALAQQSVEALGELQRGPAAERVLSVSTAHALSDRFAYLVKRLGIEDLHFHDLRHTFATNLRRAGADLFTIGAMTGHASMEMLRRYNTVTPEDMHAAIAKVKTGG